MAKLGRPFAYQSDEERPVTVSLRLPHTLHERVQQRLSLRRMTITEAIKEALEAWLEIPTDPRDIILSDDNTVMQEVQGMIRAAVQREIGKLSSFMQGGMPVPEAPVEPAPTLSHDDNTVIQDTEETAHGDTSDISHYSNTVIQEGAPRRPGRRSNMRQPIVDLLQAHPEGLSATELKVYLHAERSLSDTVQGMVRAGILQGRKNGAETKYTLASVTRP